ncbi:substrate-binding domain-containing protein [Phycicoccus sp. CSK15P-2]|uniref:molybdate ABC transporter substrate-binding protein n=1 Tax=Phycicoccus sp. CSK15P-2 TaxID=2807627 RepID=UPI00195044A2|nr:substrate-binding domain-containing protein [Phycicoccus sp. CSK15P-2]MBM6403182.1 substrate-binding domain-containing protein [Phycicoccus sp. CSK15P-2]
MSDVLRVLCSKAPAGLLDALADALADRHGVELRVESAGGVEVARRIREGAAGDLVVLAERALAALGSDGRLVPGTVRPLAVSQVVLAVGADASPPRLDTEDDLRAVLRGARAVAYSTGPSGNALTRWVERSGLDGDVAERFVQAEPGTPVGALVADGRADVGVQQLSELAGLDGVHVVGPLPGSAAATTTFAGAVLATSDHVEDARRALALICSDELGDLVVAHGMRPAG